MDHAQLVAGSRTGAGLGRRAEITGVIKCGMDLKALGLVASPSRTVVPWSGPQTAQDIFDPTLLADPQRVAVVSRHSRLSYEQLEDKVNRAAAVFRRLGVGPR